MSKHAREDARTSIVNFYNDAAGGNLKSIVNYFVKQGMEKQMVYSILQRYKQFRMTKELPRFGYPVKLSSRKLGDLVRKINNKSGISQRRHARLFMVAQSKISRNLKRRTKILKYINVQRCLNTQKINRSEHKTLPGQLYRKISNCCFVIMDDEKYFSLSNTNLPGHVYYYTSDKSAAPPDIKYKKRSKYEPTIMTQLVVSSKGICEPYTFIEVIALLMLMFISINASNQN